METAFPGASTESILHQLSNLVTDLSTATEAEIQVRAVIGILDDLAGQVVANEGFQVALGEDGKMPALLMSFFRNRELVEKLASLADTSCQYQFYTSVLWLLCRLCRRQLDKATACPGNIFHAAQHVPEIIIAVGNYGESANFCHAFCWLMMVLASDSEERQDNIIKAGAAPLLTNILNIHTANPLTTEFALRAVRNLSIYEQNANALVENNVSPAIVNVYNHYIAQAEPNLTVIEALMWTTLNLSCEEPIASKMGHDGCCACLVTALRKTFDKIKTLQVPYDPEDTNLLRIQCETIFNAGLAALRNLSCMTAQNYTELAATDACQLILDIFTHCPLNAKIAELGNWCIANLGSDKDLANRFLTIGVLPALSGELFTHYSLCFNASSIEAVTVSSTVECQQSNMESFVAFGPIAESFLWCVRNLCAGGTAIQDAFSVFTTKILIFMKMYIDREGMVELALCALMSLCNSGQVNNIRQILLEINSINMSSSTGATCPNLATTSASYSTNAVAIIACIRHNLRCVEVVENGLKLFSSFMRIDEVTRNAMASMDRDSVYALALECVFSHVGEPDIFRYTCDIVRFTRYNNAEGILRLKDKGLLEPEDDTRALPPKGKFHEMVYAWDLNSLAGELEINVHSEDWDPALIMTVSKDALGGLANLNIAGDAAEN
jgi:hypothetical protein